jgi:uncharacterized protein YegL
MSSDVTKQTVTTSENNDYHFIIILDESGSMSGYWDVVRKTYGKFTESYKNDDSKNDIFSVITFDHSARIVDKRKRAKDLAPLPALNGGGTAYIQAFVYAQQLVDMTPPRLTPAVIFMTDGNTSTSDIG